LPSPPHSLSSLDSVTAAVGKVTALGSMSCCGPEQEWQFKELCESRSLRALHQDPGAGGSGLDCQLLHRK